jgi:hypothetical protein
VALSAYDVMMEKRREGRKASQKKWKEKQQESEVSDKKRKQYHQQYYVNNKPEMSEMFRVAYNEKKRRTQDEVELDVNKRVDRFWSLPELKRVVCAICDVPHKQRKLRLELALSCITVIMNLMMLLLCR